MHFAKLGLIEPLVRAVRSEGYLTPTPIQERAIPHVLAGKDLLGCAQTGTGKTAAFALPILQRLTATPHAGHEGKAAHPRAGDTAILAVRRGQDARVTDPHAHSHSHAHRPIRALIIGPTRELASQIGESFRTYGRHTGIRHTVIFGGVGQGPQATALRDGVDVLVATPGRLLDLLNQRLLTLSKVEILVLDEADRMLDMGFIHDIRRVLALLPAKRQTLLFSATMPREIQTLADSVLHKPVEVRVAMESPAADTVQQSMYFVDKAAKPALLEQLLRDAQVTRALVFTRTKHGADKVVRYLFRAGLNAEAIHSNKSQGARTRALDNFKRGKILALIASDIAARGLDVDDISHVVNYDLPAEAETYVHRIGRTGRAGAQGQAVSFCSPEQRDELKAIERLLGRQIPVLKHSIVTPPTPAYSPHSSQGGGQQGHSQHPRQTSTHGEGGQHRHDGGSGGRHQARPHRADGSSSGQQAKGSHSGRGGSGSTQGHRSGGGSSTQGHRPGGGKPSHSANDSGGWQSLRRPRRRRRH